MNYRIIQLSKHVSKEFFNSVKKDYELEFEAKFKYKDYPPEDSLKRSNKFLIFSVADGATLEPKKGKKYPNPSSAYITADKLVKTLVKEGEKNYYTFNTSSVKKLFQLGNKEVKKINRKYKRLKNKINYLDFDLFACTSALAVIKDRKLYWATIADSFVAIFNKNGKEKFISPDGWRFMQYPKNFEFLAWQEQRIYIRKNLRNGFKNNKKIGYGVITGEEKAIKYLDYGKEKLKEGDIIFIGTDGYENYIKLKKFISLFIKWDKDLMKKVNWLEKELILKNPDKYGHERTMFVIKHVRSVKRG